MTTRVDVVVIGAGHNGLACACYLARAGLQVCVVEAAEEPGGCIRTVDLPAGRGRLELGAYEHGGIRASGVAADLELEDRFGLRFHLRDELTLAPCDDGTALAFHNSLEQTVEGLGATVGADEADAYRQFARWAEAAVALLRQTEAGPPPSLRQLAALAEATLGGEAPRLLQALLGSASATLRGSFQDERLQGPLAHWAAHSQQAPTDPGTGAGALLLAAGHGSPAARPVAGSRATVDALVRCLEAAGGTLRCGLPVDHVEVASGRAVAVRAGGERFEAARAVVSAVDARRLFLELLDQGDVPPRLLAEVRRIHVGRGNVSELKVDAVLAAMPEIPGPAGFERSFMLSANTISDTWRVAERALGGNLEPVERRVTGPADWVARTRNPQANPNHVEMSIDQLLAFRPSPSLAGYRTPLHGLFLTGAGTHPGGGVTGIPGRNAAAIVLEALGMRRRRDAGHHLRQQLARIRDASRAIRTLRGSG